MTLETYLDWLEDQKYIFQSLVVSFDLFCDDNPGVKNARDRYEDIVNGMDAERDWLRSDKAKDKISGMDWEDRKAYIRAMSVKTASDVIG